MTKKKDPNLTVSEALSKAMRERPNYLGEMKTHPIYNCWRSFKHTKTGKEIGCSEDWKSFLKFREDMLPSWEEGKNLNRIDKTGIFSKENCSWEWPWNIKQEKKDLPLTYQGKTQDLKDWCRELNLPYKALRQRYVKGKNYTHEEILFGKQLRPIRKIIDPSELKYQQVRNKASKMISSYRCRDLKRGQECNLTTDWFVENIFEKSCVYCGTNEYIGADRLDNSKGHTVENVVPACYLCNTTRKDIFTHEEMKVLGKFIREEILNKRKDSEQ